MYRNLFFAAFFLSFSVFANGNFVELPKFDVGPDPEDPMQQELVEILQDMPYVPGISEQLQVLVPYGDGQKIRVDFGAMPLRGFLKPNSVSVLVIGQDGTHIAEAANRPGIAGFGGRVQDMLLYFGIYEGVFFTNLYVNTIQGQYGSRETPVVANGEDLQYQNVIENRAWLMTHDGPYAQWRNRFLSWIIRNNMGSLRMVMMLGQAGKDAGSSFVNSIGGSVVASTRIGDGKHLKVPMFEIVSAGGNEEFGKALTADGGDVAEEVRKVPAVRADILEHLAPGIEKSTQDFEKQKVIFEPIAAEFEQAEADLESGAINQQEFNSIKRKYDNAKKAFDKAKGLYYVWQNRKKVVDTGFDYTDGDYKVSQMGADGDVSTYVVKYMMQNFPQEAIKHMVFTNGGPAGNGVLYPQQFGGWDLRTMTVKGKLTRSIEGLQIPCNGSKVGACESAASVTAPDIVFVGAPHPTSLSGDEFNNPGSAAIRVENELIKPLRAEQARGWIPPQAEPGFTSTFIEDTNKSDEDKVGYVYCRGVIPPSHGDPGITALRLLPVSDARRNGSAVIVVGTRDPVNFDSDLIEQMKQDIPSNEALLTSTNVLTGRPKFEDWIWSYDRGPSAKFAELMFNSLDEQSVLLPKPEYKKEYETLYAGYSKNAKNKDDFYEAFQRANSKIFDKYGIAAYNFKAHPDASFFGHYRGTFEKPQVVIVSDPQGYDAFATAKAATGARGQYLNGLMNDLGVGDQYLIVSTVPLMMDGATESEWAAVLASTQDYRKNLIAAVLESRPQVIIADGKYAAQELTRLGYEGFVTILQSNNADNGIIEGGNEIVKKGALRAENGISGARLDIPRSHLTWIARTWEGTSGDRVITAPNKAFKGKAFAIVAPNWARLSKPYFTAEEQTVVTKMIDILAENGEPLPGENIVDFVARRQNCVTREERSQTPSTSKKDCDLPSPVKFEGTLPDEGAYQ